LCEGTICILDRVLKSRSLGVTVSGETSHLVHVSRSLIDTTLYVRRHYAAVMKYAVVMKKVVA